ncbi:uncharacterized protein [Channa argus]|uniref:uncharacterized protein isoform X5 n=1 Tax=Channa argus TaxID=215402 RepID=UPI0035223086
MGKFCFVVTTEMSLQVCHCGWSKVTTYHGLRTHQGKMGCLLKAASVADTEQQYMWANDLRLDVYTSLKTAGTQDFHSETSLHVCHCGWAKMTTYQGFRIHQGKKGCTPKGMKIPKKEQYHGKYQWEVEGAQKPLQPTKTKVVKKENLPESTSRDVCTGLAPATATIKEESNSYYALHFSNRGTASKAGHRLQEVSTLPQVKASVREDCTPRYSRAVFRPKEKKKPHQTLSETNSGAMRRSWCIDYYSEQKQIAATIKEEPKSPSVNSHSQRGTKAKVRHQLQDFITLEQNADSGAMKQSWCADIRSNHAKTAAAVKEEIKSPSLTQHYYSQREAGRQLQGGSTDMQPTCHTLPVSQRIKTATTAAIKEEPKSSFPNPQQSSQRATNSKSGRLSQDLSTDVEVKGLAMKHPKIPTLATVIQPKEKDRKDQTSPLVRQEKPKLLPKPQMKDDEVIVRAAERVSKVKKLVQMFSGTTAPEKAVHPKKHHRGEPKPSQAVKLKVQTFSTVPVQDAAAPPQHKDRNDQNLSQVPDTKIGVDRINPVAAGATEDPKASCESAQLPDMVTDIKVKELVRMFSAITTQETAVQPKKKKNHREEPKLPEPQPRRRPSIRALQTTDNIQERQDRTTDDLKNKLQMRAQTMARCTSTNTVQPCQGSLDAMWLEINSVFLEVMKTVEDAKKSLNLSLSSLRPTTVTMMQEIHQKLDKLVPVELKCLSKFAVDIKLDPTTAQLCCVSADGMKVSEENQQACDTQGMFGSILGLNSLKNGKFYWEVEVSNKTGWYLGVARSDANRKGKTSVKTNNGFWVIAHYEKEYEEYAALTVPPVSLSLKEKTQKVGVFVDYEEGLVSFYNVTAQSHMYSFTECSFSGEIFPYFSVHPKKDGSNADPLTISPVKHH